MEDINLYQLIKFYAKKWMWIISLTILGLIGGYIYNTYIQTPLYKSEATLILINPDDKKIVQDTTLINNYMQLFKSRRVLEPVIAKLNLNKSYEDFINSIEATNAKDTEVIKVSVSTTSADTSKQLVDGAVDSFKEQVNELYKIKNVQIVDDASTADKPYNVNKNMTLIISTAAGFILSIIILFFVYDFKMSNKGKSNTKALKSKKIKEIKVKKVKVKKARLQKLGVKLATISRNIATAIAKSAEVNKVKRQAAKLVKTEQAVIAKAKKAEALEIAKIEKAKKLALAEIEKANKAQQAKVLRAEKAEELEILKIEKAKKLELAEIEKADKAQQAKVLKTKKAKQAKTKKTKKAKLAKAKREANKIKFQIFKAKLSKTIKALLDKIKKSFKASPKKVIKAKSKKKSSKSKTELKAKAKKVLAKKTASKAAKQGVFFSEIASTMDKVFTNNPRVIKREFKSKDTADITEQVEFIFTEPITETKVFEPKHGKGIVLDPKSRNGYSWSHSSARLKAQKKSNKINTLAASINKLFKKGL